MQQPEFRLVLADAEGFLDRVMPIPTQE
jgi:hypothetical protein